MIGGGGGEGRGRGLVRPSLFRSCMFGALLTADVLFRFGTNTSGTTCSKTGATAHKIRARFSFGAHNLLAVLPSYHHYRPLSFATAHILGWWRLAIVSLCTVRVLRWLPWPFKISVDVHTYARRRRERGEAMQALPSGYADWSQKE